MKPLSAWVADGMCRIDFIRDWIDKGIPAVFWISGFYFPQVHTATVNFQLIAWSQIPRSGRRYV